MAAVELVPGMAEDLEFLVATHRASMYESVAASVGWDDRFQRFRLERGCEPDFLRIITVDGERVGTISLKPRKYGVHVSHFYIRPGMQCCGIGSSVMQRVTREADITGHEIRLGVLRGSRAIRLYERFGFVADPVRQKRAKSEIKLRRLAAVPSLSDAAPTSAKV